MKKRVKELDFLRGIAIILVMLRHESITIISTRIGWMGVDLFFVLSGFLVSGILFRELKDTGAVNPGRFLIRRGFKIYPLFYLAVAVHIIFFYLKDIPLKWEAIWPELTFIQNYRPGLMGFSWSLAIEEHFYLLLCSTVFILSKIKNVSHKKIFFAASTILILCLAGRIVTQYFTPGFNPYIHFFPTHLRIDSLFAGVLISFLYNYYYQQLYYFIYQYRHLLLAILPCFFVPVFVLNPSAPFIITFGFTIVYIGWSICLVFLLLYNKSILFVLDKVKLTWFFNLIARIGFCSYAIYLIHMKAGPICSNWLYENVMPSVQQKVIHILSLFINIILGCIITKMIEVPVLKIRERYFPASQKNETAIEYS